MPAERIEKAMAVALGDPEDRKAPLPKPKASELLEAVAEFRDHGITRAQGKPIPGINAFSAPALDQDGEPVVVLTALGHQDSFSSDWNSSAATAVRNAQQKHPYVLDGKMPEPYGRMGASLQPHAVWSKTP